MLRVSDAMPQHLLGFHDFLLCIGVRICCRQCRVCRIQSSRKAAHLHFLWLLHRLWLKNDIGTPARVLAHKADGTAADYDLITAFKT
jgi:hypothetical protein